jgi:hypothetical protein
LEEPIIVDDPFAAISSPLSTLTIQAREPVETTNQDGSGKMTFKDPLSPLSDISKHLVEAPTKESGCSVVSDFDLSYSVSGKCKKEEKLYSNMISFL